MRENNDAIEVNRSANLASRLAGTPGRLTLDRVKEKEDEQEDSCPAFGYLRGLHERALFVEFRFRDGNHDFHSYSHLASWRYNPSVGILLKFTDDVVTLALIRGSNLHALVKQSVNLTDRGFQRHRILWLCEMDEMQLRRAAKGEPTIDRIEVAECESNEAVQEWLHKNAPAFVRKSM